MRPSITLIRYKISMRKRRNEMDTPEQYAAFLRGCSEVQKLEITDKLAKRAADAEHLFSYLPEYDALKKTYALEAVAAGNTDLEKAVRLMAWLAAHTFYCGMSRQLLPDDTVEILKASFQKPFRNAINCRHRAIAYADLLLAVGIKAYPVLLASNNLGDVHLVTHVFLREENKWCMFDPSFNCYFTNEAEEILSVPELRDLFLANKTPVPHGYHLNGKPDCYGVYLNIFIRQCLSNISAWKNNKRTKKQKNVVCGKKFNCKLPA